MTRLILVCNEINSGISSTYAVMSIGRLDTSLDEASRFYDTNGKPHSIQNVRELGGPVLTDEQQYSFGGNGDIVAVNEPLALGDSPIVLVSDVAQTVTQYKMQVELSDLSAFDLCGIQGRLWLNAAIENSPFAEMMGGAHDTFVEQSKERSFIVGDMYAVRLSCARSQIAALQLTARMENYWESHLWVLGKLEFDLGGEKLIEFYETEFDGVSASFEREIGTVISVIN